MRFGAARQVDRMYNHFSHNMAVVDFYLSEVVFQQDTKQVWHTPACIPVPTQDATVNYEL